MKKTIAGAFAAVSLILPTTVWGIENKSTNNNTNNTNNIRISQLALQNFIDTHCHTFRPLKAILTLNERHFHKEAWGAGAVSCRGEICWSWDRGKGLLDWQLYSSNLPLRIANTEKLSKSIAQTIKSSNSLRKSASDLVNAAQEFLQASFGGGKERGTTKERTITESKSQEQSVETNITPLFHRFLAMGVQSIWPAYYNLCLGSAADLFFKAYYTNRVNDLVEAFIFFQTMQPEDLRLTNEKSLLNRAKFLFLISKGEIKSKEEKNFGWASALLFAKLLEWDEFQEIKSIVDDYIDKVYEKYQLIKNHTTKELLEIDKELAAYKYTVDKILQSENKTQNMQEVEDFYAMIAIERFFPTNEEDEKMMKQLQQQLDEALKKNDPILNAKLIKEDPAPVKIIKENPKKIGAAGGAVIGLAGIAGALYFRKKKSTKKEGENDGTNL